MLSVGEALLLEEPGVPFLSTLCPKDSIAHSSPIKGATLAQVITVSPACDRIGLSAWPEIPRSVEWKKGVCAHLGWPHDSQADIARAWQHILARVQSYDDLEPVLLGRVEELIDFVAGSPDPMS